MCPPLAPADLVNAAGGESRQVYGVGPQSITLHTEQNALSRLVLKVRATFCQDSSFDQEAKSTAKFTVSGRFRALRPGSAPVAVRGV